MDDQGNPPVSDGPPDDSGPWWSRSSPNRVLVLIGLLVVGALVLTFAVLAVTGPTSYPVDSPEGVVQHYLQALAAEEPKAAISQLTPKLASECREDIEDYKSMGERVVLLESRIAEQTAHVDVRIIRDSGGGPFDDGRWEQSGDFELSRRSGTWRISQTPVPRWCGS